MNNKKYIIISLSCFFLLILAGCQRDILTGVSETKHFDYIPNNRDFHSEMGKYSSYFNRTDGFHSFRYSKGALYSDKGDIIASGYTKESVFDEDTEERFYINNLETKAIYQDRKNHDEIASKLLGENVVFEHRDGSGQTKYSETLYLPNSFVVDTLQSGLAKLPQGNWRLYNVKNSIYYNQDKNNTGGLLVILNYQGHLHNTSFEEITSDKLSPIKRYAYVPMDNGVLDLPLSFFDDIPNRGIIHLTIFRSNYEVFDHLGDTHKIHAGTDISMSLVLDKE